MRFGPGTGGLLGGEAHPPRRVGFSQFHGHRYSRAGSRPIQRRPGGGMDAATQPTAPPAAPTADSRPPLAFTEKQTELLLDALKAALAAPGEHRLFRWGKRGGPFPRRGGR